MQLSIWEKESFFARQDIIIAGSGVTGLWCAWHLKRKYRDARITIVDQGVIPTGASTRNAGFACFGSLSELLADEERVGTDAMLQLVEMRFRGLRMLTQVIDKKDMGFKRTGGYELFHKESRERTGTLNDKVKYLNRILQPVVGKKPFRLVDDKLESFGFGHITHLVYNKQEGYLHSGKLVMHLMQEVRALGVQVLQGITVTSMKEGGNGIAIETDRGIPLSADRFVVCTNGFAGQILPELDLVPARGQVIVTTPLDDIPWKGTFHFDRGFYYFRNLGSRVLLGGARNKFAGEEATTVMELSEPVQEELEQFLSEVILPGRQWSIEHRWSGIMGMGQEKMPIIREVRPNVFCAVRMSGMGVALAPVIGEELSNIM